MAPVQRTPPAKSPESQFTTLQRSSSKVDIGRWPTLAQIKHARRGRDERSTRASSLSSWSVSEIKHKPREADTGGLVSETVVKDVQRKRSVPKAPHGHVAVPQQSPTRSVFEDNGEEWGYALELPNDILKYLESRNWEAFYVPPDGNCLYRALTYGPEFTAHGGGRDSTGAYLSGMKQKDNVLAHTVTHEEIKEIQTGLVVNKCSKIYVRWVVEEYGNWTVAVKSGSRGYENKYRFYRWRQVGARIGESRLRQRGERHIKHIEV